jgi:lipopolysaccharide export system permease protein
LKTLHRYLTGQVLASLLMTVAVFTFVLLLGNVLKEVLALLVNQQASLLTVVQAIGLLIPYVFVFALPMGLLTATLLTFGRFSADNELTAVRASGISLLSLISPILVLSVVLSIACAFVNLQLAPQCRIAYKRLIIKTATENLERLLPERTLIRQFHPYLIYFGRARGNEVRNIYVYELGKGGTNVVSMTTARSGTFFIDRTNKTVRLHLRDAWYVTTAIGGNEGERQPVFFGEAPPIEVTLAGRPEKEPSLSDLTFGELWKKRRELKAEGMLTTPVDVEMHSDVSFSFACVAFTLVGIPLGIRAHRRETGIGIMMALLLVAVYYSFLILGQSLDTKEQLKPYLIVWLPNLLFQVVGIALLRRVNRGT